MGVVREQEFFGGSEPLTTGVNATVRWHPNQRVRGVNATAGGLTLTLAELAEWPLDGMFAGGVYINIGSNAFTLADDEGHFSESIATNQAAIVSKVGDRFTLDKREKL